MAASSPKIRIAKTLAFVVRLEPQELAAKKKRIGPMAKIFDLASAGRRMLPNHWDLIAFAFVMAVLAAVARAFHGVSVAAERARSAGDFARLWRSPLLRAAHGAAHVRRARRIFRFHLHIRDVGGQEPPPRDGADPHPRRPAIGADSRLPVVHRDLFPWPIPRQRDGGGAGGDFRHLHQPGLEHDVCVLSIAAHRAQRPRRGGARLPPHRLAEVLAARGAVRGARTWCGTR